MKNYILIAATALLSVTACSPEGETAEQKRAREVQDSLVALINDKETSVNDFIAAFDEVERNLDSVSVHQNVILMHSDGDMKLNQKVRINREIEAINDLMDANRKKLADLSKKLKRSNNKNAQLEKTIATLINQLAQKDSELASLNQRLTELDAQVAQLKTSVDTLSSQGVSKTQIINERTSALHTAYYRVGDSKELRKAKLIERKGGVLGLGKTSQLNRDLDKSKFTQIDYTQTTTIPINSKDFKMITPHPSDSYKLDKTDKMVNCILIINPEKFWSESKYLVVSN
ncbi:MAG: hypothetical protein H0W73_03720 [Bacteroidetes bacterium]|nr:hypothetical protein [Bacteroidota bacterium]